MDTDLQQQVQKRLAELPEGVRAAIRSAEVAAKIQEIGKKASLHVDQMGKLEDEVYLVMLGFADPAEFADNLAEALGVAPAAAETLATDAGNQIFMPIRALMQEWAEEQAAAQDADLVSKALAEAGPAKRLPAVPTTPAASTPVPAPPPAAPAPKPATAPNLGAAETMLSEKKVTPPAAVPAYAAPAPSPMLTTPAASPMPKVDPAKPQNYKADPYREPVE